MGKHPWLWNRNGTYWLRARVPADIAASFGKVHVTGSLRTRDPREAERLIHSAAKAVADQFEQHRRNRSAPVVSLAPPATLTAASGVLSSDAMRQLCDAHYQSVVDLDFAERSRIHDRALADQDGFAAGKLIALPTDERFLAEVFNDLTTEQQLACCFEERTERLLNAIDAALAAGNWRPYAANADAALKRHGSVVSDDDRLRLTRKLMEAEATARGDILKNDRRRYDEIVAAHGGVSVGGGGAKVVDDPGPMFEAATADYLAEIARSGAARKTTARERTDLNEFAEIASNKPLRKYTKADGIKYKAALVACPAQRNNKPFAGLPVTQAVALAAAEDPARTTIPRLSETTINDKLGVVAKLFKWANAHHDNVANPVEGMRIKRRRGKQVRGRYPFTADELTKIFNGPVYRGCKSPSRWKEAGSLTPRDSARFWVPLIALHSGMRPGEIIQLRVADIKTHGSVTYFAVTTDRDPGDADAAKSVKTATSERQIPVHPDLFRYGLQDLIALRRGNGGARLLIDYDRSPVDDSWSKTFSAWFTHYRRHVGVERMIDGKNRVDLYSFRHTFEDVVRDLPDVKQEVRDALQGHGEDGMGGRYGLGVKLERLDQAMRQVRFGLDLAHLVTRV